MKQANGMRNAALTAFHEPLTRGAIPLGRIALAKSEAERERLLHCIVNVWAKQHMAEKVHVCAVDDTDEDDLIRFDHGENA